ncbi:uncharacterized protein [Amphiura filiformis]|uniref:uncharacterized protein n=1 Tax=Amphiura filiformis TaxID=82378 RepID=UPI003B2240CA
MEEQMQCKADVSKVMRQFLLTSSSLLSEEDIGVKQFKRRSVDEADNGDLEVDADDDGPDEQDVQAQNVAKRLAEIGDDIQKKYDKRDNSLPSLNKFITSCIKQNTYAAFSEGVTELCKQSTDVLNSDTKTVAFVMFLVKKLAEASKEAGAELPSIRKNIILGEMYVKKTFGELIGINEETTVNPSSNQHSRETEVN